MNKNFYKTIFLAIFINFFLINNSPIKSAFINNNLSNKNIYNIKINKRNIEDILKLLKRYDYKNAPKKKLVNGQVTSTYRKLENEPKKSIEELEKLINKPEKTTKYKKFITKAILTLISNGVNIFVKDIKEDISAQWFYKSKTITIDEKSFKNGTKNFAYLLSHEMIHVSQSCKGGGFDSYPVLIGLDLKKTNHFNYKNLSSSAYKDLKDNEINLEMEAYAHQKNLIQTLNLFKYFCLKIR